MNLAALLIPPALDAEQALRLRRFGFAALCHVLATALVAVAWTFGMLPTSAALEVAAAYLAINLGLYVVIRSGFNLRFEDPGLTRFQILAATTVLMYVVHHMDELSGRNIALFGRFIVFLFGIFCLNAREFIAVTLYTLAACPRHQPADAFAAASNPRRAPRMDELAGACGIAAVFHHHRRADQRAQAQIARERAALSQPDRDVL